MTVSIGGATVSGGVTIGTAIVPIVTSGLVLSLDAGNSSSYPGTGTTWTDLSGSVNTGTVFNSPVYSSANGGYLDFDGIDDYASGANSVSTDLTGDMSCEVWFKLDAVAGDWVTHCLSYCNHYQFSIRSGSSNTNAAVAGHYDVASCG